MAKLSAFVLLFALSSTSGYAQCISDRAFFYYVNGVWNTDTDAELGREALENALNGAFTNVDGIRCGIPVVLAQNTSVNKIADLYESAKDAGFTSDAAATTFLNLLSHLVAS